MKYLITYGDSHSQGRFGWGEACSKLGIDLYVKYEGPKLLHTIVKTPVEHILRNRAPELTKPSLQDLAFFLTAGEIDIRCHVVGVAEQKGVSIDDVAHDLADRTADWLKSLDSKTHASVFCMIPVAPIGEQTDEGVHFRRVLPTGEIVAKVKKNWFSYDDFKYFRAHGVVDQFTNVGSPSQRLAAHQAYRQRIYERLSWTPVGVMDLTDWITGEDGLLRNPPEGVSWQEWSESDGTHLTTSCYHTRWLED